MTWTDEGYSYGGVTGGDGAGTAHTRRFTHDNGNGTFRVVDVAYYAVDLTARGEEHDPDWPFDVEEQTWDAVVTDLTDPGGSEVTSDYMYDFPSATGFRTEEAAEAYAEGMAKRFDVTVLG